MKRFFIPFLLVVFAAFDSSVKESPDGASEIEQLVNSQRGKLRAVLITKAPEYHALFEFEETGRLSDGRLWGAADAGEFLLHFTIMQIKTTAKHNRDDSFGVFTVVDCTMKKGAWLAGLGDFASCLRDVSEHCNTGIYTDSEDGYSLEAHGGNVTYNSDGTATVVPCRPPDPWKG